MCNCHSHNGFLTRRGYEAVRALRKSGKEVKRVDSDGSVSASENETRPVGPLSNNIGPELAKVLESVEVVV